MWLNLTLRRRRLSQARCLSDVTGSEPWENIDFLKGPSWLGFISTGPNLIPHAVIIDVCPSTLDLYDCVYNRSQISHDASLQQTVLATNPHLILFCSSSLKFLRVCLYCNHTLRLLVDSRRKPNVASLHSVVSLKMLFWSTLL